MEVYLYRCQRGHVKYWIVFVTWNSYHICPSHCHLSYIRMQACIVALYATGSSGRLQCYGDAGRVCVRAMYTHLAVIGAIQPVKWHAEGLDFNCLSWHKGWPRWVRQNIFYTDRKCWWELKVSKFIYPGLFSNEVSVNSCTQREQIIVQTRSTLAWLAFHVSLSF